MFFRYIPRCTYVLNVFLSLSMSRFEFLIMKTLVFAMPDDFFFKYKNNSKEKSKIVVGFRMRKIFKGRKISW